MPDLFLMNVSKYVYVLYVPFFLETRQSRAKLPIHEKVRASFFSSLVHKVSYIVSIFKLIFLCNVWLISSPPLASNFFFLYRRLNA